MAAGTFHNTFRLIDTVLSVDDPLMVAALSKPYEERGLYPAALELKQTSKSSRMADFLGIHLETDSNCFHLSVYDKRKEFPFRVRRYPMMASLIPRTIPCGVFLGKSCSHDGALGQTISSRTGWM